MTSRVRPLPDVLVLDTSVLINLTSVERWRDVLAALPTILAPTEVTQELKRNPRTRKPDPGWRSDVLSRIKPTSLAGPEVERFISLVASAPMDSLGDGEAATLALSEGRGIQSVVDERKARRIARSLAIEPPISTVAIYQWLELGGEFSRIDVGHMVYQSLRIGRMQVFPDEIAWVVAAIGEDRAQECASLRRHFRSQ